MNDIYTEQQIIERDGPIIYRFADLSGLSEFDRMRNGLALEYIVVDCEKALGGIIVFGRYKEGDKWEPNPGGRLSNN